MLLWRIIDNQDTLERISLPQLIETLRPTNLTRFVETLVNEATLLKLSTHYDAASALARLKANGDASQKDPDSMDSADADAKVQE